MPIYRVHDVLNYGGFFAGDTVTLTAHAIDAPNPVVSGDTLLNLKVQANGDEQTFTIDQGALTNVGGDRYKIVAGVVLDLQFEGERVAAATVVAARERETLRKAVVARDEPLNAPRIFAHHCAQCDLWILGEPKGGKCGLEGHPLK